jgi:hypothetical protein
MHFRLLATFLAVTDTLYTNKSRIQQSHAQFTMCGIYILSFSLETGLRQRFEWQWFIRDSIPVKTNEEEGK